MISSALNMKNKAYQLFVDEIPAASFALNRNGLKHYAVQLVRVNRIISSIPVGIASRIASVVLVTRMPHAQTTSGNSGRTCRSYLAGPHAYMYAPDASAQ